LEKGGGWRNYPPPFKKDEGKIHPVKSSLGEVFAKANNLTGQAKK
jgi:hypothetical protein